MDEAKRPESNEQGGAGGGSQEGSVKPGGEPPYEVERPSLLEGFDEDEDFDKPPKVERKPELPRRVKPMPWEAGEAKGPREDLLRPRLGGWRLWVGIAGAMVVAAAVLTGIRLGSSGFWPAVAGVTLVLYNTLIHSVTGTAALYATAWTGSRRIASVETAAARMGAAVAALLLVQSVDVGLFSSRIEEFILGAVAYIAVVFAALRLDRTMLLILSGTHAGLWTILYFGQMLARSVHGAGGS